MMVHSMPLIVFSHLRWNFVFQRPQHLLSRLAQERPVIFVEEPIVNAGGTCLECRGAFTEPLRLRASLACRGSGI